MPDAPALASVPPGGSLDLLAYGYRGLVAWRAVRGTDWHDQERQWYADDRAARDDARRAAVEKRRRDAPPKPDLTSVEVVVVTGLPRSGTSMLMQMLTAGGLPAFTDDAREADASNPRGYYEHDRIRALATDKGWLPDADGHVAKVVAPLLPHLPPGPRYHVVFLDRDVDEVLRSQRRMLGRLGRPAVDDDVLRPAYRRHVEAARRWVERAPTARGLTLAHAEVLADPAAAARRLADFLDRPLDVDAMAAAVDASLYRERSR